MSVLVQQASDVYIQEINLSQVITSASSATAGQIIVSSQGTTTQPLQFTSAQAYLAEYGNPNAAVSFDVYCGLDFFTEGNDLWGLRVVGTGAAYSALLLYFDGIQTRLLPIQAGIISPASIDWATIAPSPTDVPLAVFYPSKGQGSYGNLSAISIASSNIESPPITATSATTGGSLVAATYEYILAAIGGNGEVLPSSPATVVIAGGGATSAITINWTDVPNATGYVLYGRTADASLGFLQTIGVGVQTFTDTGGITPDTTHKPLVVAPSANPIFTINIYDLNTSVSTPAETFDCTLLEYTDGNGNNTEIMNMLNSFSQFMNVISNVTKILNVPGVNSSSIATLAGGASGAAPTSYQVAAAFSTFSNKQLYSINTFINAGRGDVNVQQTMDTLATTRGDAVSLLDVPSNQQQFQQAINYRNLQLNLNTTYSSLFSPDMLEADNINGKNVFIPFSGWAAALCARTDRVANPSFSIAGLNRGLVSVIHPRYVYDEGEMGLLFNARVNYTRVFSGAGTALWEQQTLASQPSALQWLSVRRIVNVMKTSIYSFLLYSLQEPNDDFTGRQIVGAITSYLGAVQNARGINSFDVVSDASNNSAAQLNSGIRVVTVIVIPTIPVNQINLQMVISKQGVNFSETLSAVAGM